MGFHEVKSFCNTKEIVTRGRGQPTGQERIFDGGQHLGCTRTQGPKKHLINTRAHVRNRQFSKGETQMTKKYLEKKLYFLTLRLHPTSVRRDVIKKNDINKDVGRERSTADRSVN